MQRIKPGEASRGEACQVESRGEALAVGLHHHESGKHKEQVDQQRCVADEAQAREVRLPGDVVERDDERRAST